MTKILVLLRGLPGAGKPTTSVKLFPNFQHLEADMYHMENGVYNFRPELVKESHEWCRKECERAMKRGLKIVVSNTFTQEWEMEKYYELAKENGYTVFSLIVENRHGGINVHNVPEEVLDKMKNRFEAKL